MRTHVNFARVNIIEAMYERSHGNVTIERGSSPLTRFWLLTLTRVNFNHVNKIET